MNPPSRDSRDEHESAASLTSLAARVHHESALASDAFSMQRLRAMVRTRMSELAIDTATYFAKVREIPEEYARIEAAFTPPETWLFRYPESFEFVRAFARAHASEQLQVLVLGCGGWCEPYALAASIFHGRSESSRSVAGCVIHASDRNGALFRDAPTFSGMHVRAELPLWARRYFPVIDANCQPDDSLHSMVRAQTCDLASTMIQARAAATRYDIVCLRNVAIYFTAQARDHAFRNACKLVAPGGVLLVGHSEVHAASLATSWIPVDVPGAFALMADASVPRAAQVVAETLTPRAMIAAKHLEKKVSALIPMALTVPALDALARAHAQVALTPFDAQAHVALALELEMSGDLAHAAASITKALYLDRFCEAALVAGARLAETRGATGEASRLRARALRVHLSRESDEGRS